MTETEIKELINMLKKEGCNSKKQAIEYLEKKINSIRVDDKIKSIKKIPANFCYICDAKISGDYYSNNHIVLCEGCGNRYIVYNDSLEEYVYRLDDKETFCNDEISNIYTFERVDK